MNDLHSDLFPKSRVDTFALAIVAVILVWLPGRLHAEETVSFQTEVMAVLSKAGCNRGACHGNQNGKGGFRLSLRGQDPAADLKALVHEQFSRRIDRLAPDASLMLLKPTGQVPHQGGRRFDKDSLEYRLLRDWIAQGAADDQAQAPRLAQLEVTPGESILVEPQASVHVKATAVFSDGSRRDVGRLATYEFSDPIATVDDDGLVEGSSFGETTLLVRYLDRQAPVRLAFVPARPEFAWQDVPEHNYIDRHVFARLKALRMRPSQLCNDSVFIRRAYLDLLGVLPTADDARRFVEDNQEDKRARLVEALLERPEFADWWALKWSDLLRNEEKVLDPKGVQAFHHWIRQSIADGKPLDEFVRQIIAARGSTYAEPAANYYRANRDPITRGEATAQLFLGTRLQCAKCHNHPFDRWTQDDYYGWAALFSRVQYKIVENRRRDGNDKHEFDGEQIVWMAREGELDDPRHGRAATPRFLGESDAALDDNDRLEALADWLTGADNRQFARAQVNRIWYHLTGRGIVSPLDDFRATNPPSNPELLEALTDDFVGGGYDLRRLIRTITASHVYQLSAEPNHTNRGDEANFSHAALRRLTAEQLADALDHVTGTSTHYDGSPPGLRAAQLPGVLGSRTRRGRLGEPDGFLAMFGKPVRLLTCECERSDETTMGQAFELISGERVNQMLTSTDNRLTRLLSSDQSTEERIANLYWTAISRPPTAAETVAAKEYVDRSDTARAAWEDITWALINSKEFLFRR